MFVHIGEESYEFQRIEIDVLETGIQNTYSKFNKMTLQQLVQHKKYEHLAIESQRLFPQLLDKPAGEAVWMMKQQEHTFYKQFLNNYGDLAYSKFAAKGSEEDLQKHGVYLVIVQDELVFTGVCARSFRERFNQHIGNISAKGCFKDGTATHCHINAQLTKKIETHDVYFAICPIAEKKQMNHLKNAIIRRFEPVWNLRMSNDTIEYARSY